MLEATLDEMDRMTANGGLGSGVKTGFEQLDEITHGLHPGQMIVVAGRPGSGKSTLAMDFARSAAIKQRQPTVIFSLEMSKQDIVMRLFSAEARVKLNDIRSGRMTDDDWRKIALRASELSEAPLFIDDSPNLTMMEIRAKSRRLKQRHDLKLIVIDYMQLMTSGTVGSGSRSPGGGVAWGEVVPGVGAARCLLGATSLTAGFDSSRHRHNGLIM